MEDITKSKCYKRLKVAIKVSFVTNIVLVVALPCVYIAHRINDSSSQLTDSIQPATRQSQVDKIPDRICLTCSYFNDVIGTEKDVLYDVVSSSNGHRLCCFKDEFGVQNIFVEMLMKNKYDPLQQSTRELKEITQEMQWWRERDFAAHLYGDFHDIKSGILPWTFDDSLGTGFIRNLTLLPGNSSVILMTVEGGGGGGLYFIYSLVTLTIDISTKSYSALHTIKRSNAEILNGAPSTLAERKLGGSSAEATETIRSFLCITERLTIGDTLSVSVRVPDNYSFKSTGMFSNYFGMFKL